METAIAIFLGAFLMVIGIIGYVRISKDFKDFKETEEEGGNK